MACKRSPVRSRLAPPFCFPRCRHAKSGAAVLLSGSRSLVPHVMIDEWSERRGATPCRTRPNAGARLLTIARFLGSLPRRSNAFLAVPDGHGGSI